MIIIANFKLQHLSIPQPYIKEMIDILLRFAQQQFRPHFRAVQQGGYVRQDLYVGAVGAFGR
jgi:hypothetical protein